MLSKRFLLRLVNELPERSVVTIDGTRSAHIDTDVVEILREFDKLSEGRTNPQSAGFFSAVKGFWDSMKG